MPLPAPRDVPTRLVTGAYILHSGLGKWDTPPERAVALHGVAKGAYPFLEKLPPERFVRALAAAEVATGSVILAPFVSNRKAGLALTAFSGGLMGMYWRTPSLHEPGSIWPTSAGTAVSKDVWMLGVGLGLLIDRRARRKKKKARKGTSRGLRRVGAAQTSS